MKRLILAATAMLMIAAPALASEPGDVLRTTWSDPYMLGNSATRMVFPDSVTVQTWGSPDASVVDAPQLSQWTLAGALPIREGSRLVKFGTDPQVYAVGPKGTLHWIASEALAENLYGADWDSKVVTLFASFFPIYTVGDAVTIAHHPDGTLLKYADDPTVYYMMNDQARPFANEAAFKTNDFSFASVLTVSRDFHYSSGTPITGWEQGLNLNLAPKSM